MGPRDIRSRDDLVHLEKCVKAVRAWFAEQNKLVA